MRAALVDNDGLVVNMILIDPDDPPRPADGTTIVTNPPRGTNAGGTLRRGVFTPATPPEPPTPTEDDLATVIADAIEAGATFADVKAAVIAARHGAKPPTPPRRLPA